VFLPVCTEAAYAIRHGGTAYAIRHGGRSQKLARKGTRHARVGARVRDGRARGGTRVAAHSRSRVDFGGWLVGFLGLDERGLSY
jgi:hypothetical protein